MAVVSSTADPRPHGERPASDRPVWRVLAFLAALILAWVAYQWFFDSDAVRFRLTVDVATPNGIRSGSSVIVARSYKSGCWGPVEACRTVSEAEGEAVHVDLGNGRHVFAVLGWGAKGEDRDKVFGIVAATLAPNKRVEWDEQQKLKGSGNVPPDYIPTFVTFDNLKDPKTARIVAPDEFEKVFGPGFRLAGVRLETTSNSITRSIASVLPWLSTTDYLNGRGGCAPTEAHCLYRGNFRR